MTARNDPACLCGVREASGPLTIERFSTHRSITDAGVTLIGGSGTVSRDTARGRSLSSSILAPVSTSGASRLPTSTAVCTSSSSTVTGSTLSPLCTNPAAATAVPCSRAT